MTKDPRPTGQKEKDADAGDRPQKGETGKFRFASAVSILSDLRITEIIMKKGQTSGVREGQKQPEDGNSNKVCGR